MNTVVESRSVVAMLVPGNMEANFSRFMALQNVARHYFDEECMLEVLRRACTAFRVTQGEPTAEWTEVGATTMRMTAFLLICSQGHAFQSTFQVTEEDRDLARKFFDPTIIREALSPVSSRHKSLERFLSRRGATVELRAPDS